MKPVRVLIADEQTLVVEGLCRILDGYCEVVGRVENGHALIDAVSTMEPDIVILEVALPLLNGLEAGRRIKLSHPHIKLIYLTSYADYSYVNKAMNYGASGYLLKRSNVSELLQSLESVQRGLSYLTPLVTRGLLKGLVRGEFPTKGGLDNLTSRQREVLQLVAEGYAVKEIAVLLKLSPKTVAFHKANLMMELQLRTTVALTRYAIESGLVVIPKPEFAVAL